MIKAKVFEKQRRIRDIISEKVQQSHYKELSNKILNGLDNLLSRGSSSEARWIWELIQNAKDSSAGQNKVKIEIQTSNDQVIFSHSGNPFSLDDIFSIVNQTSSKNRMDLDQDIDENLEGIPETTGKFGTGFITTHLLSRVIYLKSIYQEYEEDLRRYCYRKFELKLDRSSKSLVEFIEEYKRLFKIFELLADPEQCPETDYQPGDISTQYIYPLGDDHSRGVMEEGLKNFRGTAALVMAFNQKIDSIRVNDEVYMRHQECVINANCKRIVIMNGNNEQLKQIILLQEQQVQLAFETGLETNIYTIKPKSEMSPGLFSDFPLIGSHEFIFPCIINSHLFWPNEERSCIILKQSQRSDNNIKLLKKGISLIMRFFVHIDFRWNQIENLFRISVPFNTDKAQYEQQIVQPYLNWISEIQFINSVSNKRLSLSDIVFPDVRYHNEEQGQLLYNLIVPFQQNLIEWDYQHINRWFDIFKLNSLWNTLFQIDAKIISFKQITSSIVNCKTLSVFTTSFFTTAEQSERYLENLYYYMIQMLRQTDWYEQEIFVNQLGHFKRYSILKEDCDNVDEVYKNMLETLNEQPRTWLFHKNIQLKSFSFLKMEQWSFNDCIFQLEEILESPSTTETNKLTLASMIVQLDHPLQTAYHQEFIEFLAKFYPQQVNEKVAVELFDIGFYNKCKKYILSQICQQIHDNCAHYKDLQQIVKQDNEWIQGLYRFVVEQFTIEELVLYKIFVNQYGIFCDYNELSQDADIVDDSYKDIAFRVLGEDFRQKLFSNDISLEAFHKYAIPILSFKDITKIMEKQLLLKSFEGKNILALILAKELITLRSDFIEHDENFREWARSFEPLKAVQQVKHFDSNLLKLAQDEVLSNICKIISDQCIVLTDLQRNLSKYSTKCSSQIDCSHCQNWLELMYEYMHQYTPSYPIAAIVEKYKQHKVFLNQLYQFKMLTDLTRDIDSIDEVYKDILANHNDDIRHKLLNNRINIGFQFQLNSITFENIVEKFIKLMTYEPKNYNNQPNKNYSKESLTEEQIRKLSWKTITLVPSEVSSVSEAFYDWLSKCEPSLLSKVKVNNFSDRIFQFARRKIMPKIIETVREFKNIKSFNPGVKQYGYDKWLKELYEYILQSSLRAEEYYNGIIPNKYGVFIERVTDARIDEILNCKDVIENKISSEILGFCESSKSINSKMQNLVDPRLEQFLFEKKIVCKFCTLKKISELLDNEIYLRSNQYDIVKSTGIILGLDKISQQGFKQEKFQEYFPMFFLNSLRYLAYILANNPQISQVLSILFEKQDGQQIISKLAQMNQQQISQVNQIISNPSTEQMLQQFTEMQPEFQRFVEFNQQSVQLDQSLEQKLEKENQFYEVPSQQEKEYMNKEYLYFVQNSITNESDFDRILNERSHSTIFREYLRNQAEKAFLHVAQIIERAVNSVQEKLSLDVNYDTREWIVDSNATNKNIINGVKKCGIDIIVVIRPTDGQFIRFNEELEKQALMAPLTELWGNNQNGITQQITLGEVLEWNKINELNVKN